MEHIVILKKKYLNLILEGKKTIESRWTMNKCAPYHNVNIGDILYLKEVGKDVSASARVSDVKFFELNDKVIDEIIDKYGKDICISDRNKDRCNKRYCTLVWVEDVRIIEPFSVKKSYGTAWMIVK